MGWRKKTPTTCSSQGFLAIVTFHTDIMKALLNYKRFTIFR